MKAHGGWVTALACPVGAGANDLKLVSASRDKTLLVWRNGSDEESVPHRRLEGHSSFVSDVALSSTGEFAVSCSWDRALRLWDLKKGETLYRFHGHTNDVLSVAFSPNNRRIASGSRDKTVKIWNVRGECVHTLSDGGHTDWVTSVRFNQSNDDSLISVGWDATARVWDLTTSTCKSTVNCFEQVNCVTVSPDSSLFATADKSGVTRLWDTRSQSALYTLQSDQPVSQICFSPNRYWLCAATPSSIRIYDLESKEALTVLEPEVQNVASKKRPECTSIAWSADGTYLYSGYTDNTIRVWAVTS